MPVGVGMSIIESVSGFTPCAVIMAPRYLISETLSCSLSCHDALCLFLRHAVRYCIARCCLALKAAIMILSAIM